MIYNNNVYTSSTIYLHFTKAEMDAILGEYLGKASGEYYQDKWIPENGFRSTESGDIYSIKGYDKDFRICIPHFTEDENSFYIHFLENLNGISVRTGKDIFGDRMNMKSNYSEVFYENRNDINDKKKLNVFTNLDYDVFINNLYEAVFIEETNLDLYKLNSGRIIHLYFRMKDKTEIKLSLYEEGYVSYFAKNGQGSALYFKTDNSNFFQMIFSFQQVFICLSL